MDVAPFKLVAGHVALDFVNTLDNRYVPDRMDELLPTYEELSRFCLESQTLSASQRIALEHIKRSERTRALATAWNLREMLNRLFTAIARGETPSGRDVDGLNGYLQRWLGHRQLEQEARGLRWEWSALASKAAGPLWQIAFAGAELLTSPNLEFVRECQSETCRWLFLDLSKNHSRRWCDMKSCGNRVKARRYYERQGRNE